MVMRALLALVLLGGCLGAGVGPTGSAGASRPGVMPMLSELPRDPAKRDAVLDSAGNTAGPEQRQGLTGKERRAETAAATAAAILGGLFSKTQSVTIGGATQFDESPLIAPGAMSPPPQSADDPNAANGTSNADLIPWIKLK